jgi:hypothetical protein
VTERKTLGDLDFQHEMDTPEDDDGWYGSALVAEPNPSDDVGDPQADDFHAETWDNAEDTDRWHVPTEAVEPAPTVEVDYQQHDAPPVTASSEPEEAPWTDWLAPRNGRSGVTTAESWQSKVTSSGAWDFKTPVRGPWYGSRRVVTAAIAVAVTSAVVVGVLLLLRSPGSGVEESPSVSPTNPTSAQPAPASSAPQLSDSAPPPVLLPPPPPPPPPPPAAEIAPPPANGGYTPPRQSAPSQSDMPEIGVTRTPVTRAPMSATPPPPKAPDRNSSTPGDGPKGGWGRW